MGFESPLRDRRSFLKGVGAAGAVVAGGFAIDAALTVQDPPLTLLVEGREADTAYHVAVDDPGAIKQSVDGGTLDVTHASGVTQFEGILGRGDEHLLGYDGDITRMFVTDGHAGFEVDGNLDVAHEGGIKIWKRGFYHVAVAGRIEPADGIENEDSGAGKLAQGVARADADRYAVDGDLAHVELRSRVGATVALQHTFSG